jgi:uncharacterized delta-60 repeat protein
MRIRTLTIIAVVAICLPAISGARGPSSGDLDPTFGTSGRVVLSPNVAPGATDVVVQPDGKIVLAASAYARRTRTADFLAARLRRGGALDRSFGTAGIVRTPVAVGGDGVASASAAALGPDGSVVLAGEARGVNGEDVAVLVRYTASGRRDTRFSGDGIQTLNLGANEELRDVAVQSDGRIVAVGNAGAGLMALRLLPDGSLDRSFGSDGVVDTSVGDPRYRDVATAVLLSESKIVLAGVQDLNYPNPFVSLDPRDFVLVRYLPDGQRDATFGSDGIVVTPGPRQEIPAGIAASAGGKILVAGTGYSPGIKITTEIPERYWFQLARYLPSGELDATFGGGVVTTGSRCINAQATDVAVQPSGRILVGGTANRYLGNCPFSTLGISRFAVAAYDDQGRPEWASGLEGIVRYGFSFVLDHGSALGIQPAAAGSGEDRLVLAGSAYRSLHGDQRVVALGIDLGRPYCRVPHLVGLTLRRARARVRSANCTLGRVRHARSSRPRGRVISQRPAPGRVLRDGRRINLVLSRGR